jgi:hypothetical protein
MNSLMQVSHQWATRPADERFTSLPELLNKVDGQRQRSSSTVVSSRQIKVQPAAADERKGIEIVGRNGQSAIPTHWSFGQLASLSGAPASYLRKLPAPLVADCVNYGLRFNRDAEDIGLLLTRETAPVGDLSLMPGHSVGLGPHIELRAATGPGYGRVWNSEIVEALMHKFGDGRTGDFRVPGEFGHEVAITKDNTTIYGSDRDIFVFLADEKHRIDMPNRRNGETGSLARGFFVWNSEVGSQSIGAAFFLFDYVCQNRIVWGVREFKEMRLRHTKSAPDRWLEEISPVLVEYSNASSIPVMETIKAAQDKKLADDLDDFLAKRFTKSEATAVKAAHEREEGRPIETLWDVVTGVTAHAKTLPYQDSRVAMERVGGKILDLVAA